jgi:hypothetical protein
MQRKQCPAERELKNATDGFAREEGSGNRTHAQSIYRWLKNILVRLTGRRQPRFKQGNQPR